MTTNTHEPRRTIAMLKRVLYGKYDDGDFIRFLNVVYSGRDEDTELSEVTKKNLNRYFKKSTFIGSIRSQIMNGRKKCKLKTRHYYKQCLQFKKPFQFIIFGETPPISGCHLLGKDVKDRNSRYYGALKGLVNLKTNSLSSQLIEKKVLFIDIMPIPLPINEKLRNKWSYEFTIGKINLSAILFMLALKHAKSFGINDHLKIALMMPGKTADGIIMEAFKKEPFILPQIAPQFDKNVIKQLKSRYTDKYLKKCLEDSTIPSTFKVLALDRSNYPNAAILKMIFDIR
jgi:hypothetical protein